MEENLLDELSRLLKEIITRNGCEGGDFLPTVFVPEKRLGDFLDMYTCWEGRPGVSGSDTVKTSDLEEFRKSIPPGYFGDGEIVLNGMPVALRKDDTLTNDFYIRLYNVH